jgi:glycosyltransferase involved in cell wall biosynthesis
MTLPLFSIVIPTFNRSNLFPFTVRSLLSQSFEDFEIVISDNCSTDDTPRVAREFTDPRVRYVRTPHHTVIADSWEFARRQAVGQLIIMLSDDDALVGSALARFAHEVESQNADFLFSAVATYRDRTFPGPERNSLDCPGFSGTTRTVSVDEFVRPLFLFKPRFSMHPSAFVFSRVIAELVEARTGRFFWTNGVEYSAWPMAAIFSKCLVCIDLPLTILGRTGQSWGSNMTLCNPGKERIQTFIDDVDHDRKHAPLNNFTISNLMAEGMLTAKALFPAEFDSYPFDEAEYLRCTTVELARRRALGVDVTTELEDVRRYAATYPHVLDELQALMRSSANGDGILRRFRPLATTIGAMTVWRRIQSYRLGRTLARGGASRGFSAPGDRFGFADVSECAAFLTAYVDRAQPGVGGRHLAAELGSPDVTPIRNPTSVPYAARE